MFLVLRNPLFAVSRQGDRSDICALQNGYDHELEPSQGPRLQVGLVVKGFDCSWERGEAGGRAEAAGEAG